MKNWKILPFASLTFAAITFPSLGFDLTINPPVSLTIDGLPISQGQFNLTGLIGFMPNGNLVDETIILDPAISSDDVIINATINGSGLPKNILQSGLNNDFQALNIIGFFDGTNPDTPPVDFGITVFGMQGEGPGEFTYGLGQTSTQSLVWQVTDVGDTNSTGDNNNGWYNLPPILDVVDSEVVPIFSQPPIDSSNGVACSSLAGINAHGQQVLGSLPSLPAPSSCTQQIPESSNVFGLLFLALLGCGQLFWVAIKRR